MNACPATRRSSASWLRSRLLARGGALPPVLGLACAALAAPFVTNRVRQTGPERGCPGLYAGSDGVGVRFVPSRSRIGGSALFFGYVHPRVGTPSGHAAASLPQRESTAPSPTATRKTAIRCCAIGAVLMSFPTAAATHRGWERRSRAAGTAVAWLATPRTVMCAVGCSGRLADIEVMCG